MFWYRTGKLRRVYDESVEAAAELQKSESVTYRIDPIDFGRRIAVEKELIADAEAPRQNAIFDESGNFLLYSTVLGIKVRTSDQCQPLYLQLNTSTVIT